MPESLLNFVQGDLTCSLFPRKRGQTDIALPQGQTEKELHSLFGNPWEFFSLALNLIPEYKEG